MRCYPLGFYSYLDVNNRSEHAAEPVFSRPWNLAAGRRIAAENDAGLLPWILAERMLLAAVGVAAQEDEAFAETLRVLSRLRS